MRLSHLNSTFVCDQIEGVGLLKMSLCDYIIMLRLTSIRESLGDQEPLARIARQPNHQGFEPPK